MAAFSAAGILGLSQSATPALAAVTEQLVSLAKPGGSTQRYVLTLDSARTPTPEIGVILFSGGDGQIHLAKGIPQPGANFLVRSRKLFAEDGLAVALYDPGGDLGALSDSARMSASHVDEVLRLLADFKAKTGVRKIYLVGTSRGTISAAYLATVAGSDVDGVVLTSTLFSSSRAGAGLSGFDFSTVTRPLLFVHHTSDGCKVTAPGFARALERKYPVIWVDGVDGLQGDACGPYSPHGYLGREPATVRAITDWILYRKLATRIDAASLATPPAASPDK